MIFGEPEMVLAKREINIFKLVYTALILYYFNIGLPKKIYILHEGEI